MSNTLAARLASTLAFVLLYTISPVSTFQVQLQLHVGVRGVP